MQQPPKSRKFRKVRSRVLIPKGKRALQPLEQGFEFGLRLKSSGQLTARQIEAARRVIVRVLKREGKLKICVFPDQPVTKKPLEVRQGKGKGNVEYYVFVARAGALVFQLTGVDAELAKKALDLATDKLPLKAEFVQAG